MADGQRGAIGAGREPVVKLAQRGTVSCLDLEHQDCVGQLWGARGLHGAYPLASMGARKNISHARPGEVWLALMNATTRRSVRRSTAALKASSRSAWNATRPSMTPPAPPAATSSCSEQLRMSSRMQTTTLSLM